MFRTIIFIATAITILFTPSCKQKGNNTHAKADTTASKLIIPQVPVAITDPGEKVKYLINSFWNNYDFSDTALLEKGAWTEGPVYGYLSMVKKYKSQEIISIYSHFISGLMKRNPKTREKFLSLIEYNLYHPNSEIRDEELYSVAIDKAIDEPTMPQAERERYLFQKRIIAKNNPGRPASDFNFVTLSGTKMHLYGIRSHYTILVLFDPECGHCMETLDMMKKSPVINTPGVKVVAIMAENNRAKLERGQSELLSEWIAGYDSGEEIMNGLLYDLRPSPSLYLLDSSKRVIIKDGSWQEIEIYLARTN
jgi:hypothetical protein